MFLRAAKTEAEEAGESTEGMATSVSELRQEILDLTGNRVDIQVEGKEEFKSTYQILKELSEVWESLSDLTQANILEMVGGKRNANIVAAIVENFSVADSAFKTSMNSAGSAMAENLKALDSVEGRINIFKAAFESFSANLIGDEMIKDVVDFGTSFIGVLDGIADVINALGGLENALFVVAGIVTMIQSQKIGHFLTVTLGGGIANLGKSIAGIGTTFMTTFSAARASGATTLSALSSGFKGLAASAGAANLAIGSFIAVVSIINMVSDAVERARQETIAFNEEQAADASSAVDRANALHVAMAEYQRYSQISDRTQDQETAMQNALSTVTEQINSKTTALKGLTEGTKEYTAALEEQVRKEIEGTSLEAKKGLQSAESAVRSSAWSDFKGNLTEFKIESNTIHKDQNLLEALKIAEDILGDRFGIDNDGHRDSIDRYVAKADINARTQSIEEIVQYFYELEKLEDELATRDVDGNLMGTDLYREVARKTEELSAVVETLQKAQFDLLSQTYKEENGIPETTDDYKKYVHEIEKSFASAFGYDFIRDTTLIDSILAPFFANEGLADIVVEPIQEVVETVDEVISDNERTRRMVEDFWGGDETSDIADNLKEIADASEEISAEKIVELAEESEELAAILDRPGMTPEFLAGVFEDLASNRNGLDNITDEALELNDVLEGLADQFDSVREAKKRYDDAMSVDEKDTNFKSYAEAYKTLDEQFAAGTVNSNAFWASAEYLFGAANLEEWDWEVKKIRAAMVENLALFKDADSAGFGFLNRFRSVAEDGKLFDALGNVIAEVEKLPAGGFDVSIDEKSIPMIADLLNLSQEAVIASVEALSMWGDIDYYNIEEVVAQIKEAGTTVANAGGLTVINSNTLKKDLENVNMTKKEIEDLLSTIEEADKLTLFGSDMDSGRMLSTLEALKMASSSEYGIDVDYERVTRLFKELGFTTEEAEKTIYTLSRLKDLKFRSLENEIIDVEDALKGVSDIGLPGALTGFDFLAQRENLGDIARAFWDIRKELSLIGEDGLKVSNGEIKGIDGIRSAISETLSLVKGIDNAELAFLEKYMKVAKDGKLVNSLGDVIAEIKEYPNNGFKLAIDEESISIISKMLDMSKESVVAYTEALDEWGASTFHSAEDMIAQVSAFESAFKSFRGNAIVNARSLDEAFRNLELLDLPKDIVQSFHEAFNDIEGLTTFSSDMGFGEIVSTLHSLDIASTTQYGIDVDYDGVTELFKQLDLTEEEAESVISTLSRLKNLKFKSLENGIISVDDALSGIKKLDLSNVTDQFNSVTSAANRLNTMLIEIDGKKVTVDISAEGLQNAANAGAGLVGYADGINSAPRGIALVGEEDPELVQSGDKARLVGINGPEVTYLQKGDRVYNAEETEKIMRDLNNHSGSFPAFAGGGVYGGISGNKWESLLDGGGSSSGGSSGGSSSSSSSSSKNGDEESEFERLYKYHQHLLAMEQESVEDYLEWLDKAYREAYNSGQIDLDEYRQYCEEVYQGLRDLFKDYLNDTEHEISMRENFDGESVKIISLYEEMIDRIEKEIDAARDYGLDNNNDYVQELQDKYIEYTDRIEEIRDEASESAKSALEELVDIRMKMLEEDVEAEKDAIKEKLDSLKDFYDKQKEMLQDLYDEEKYLEEQSEKRKSVSDIQAEIAQLQYDDSAWAQKRKLELASELSEAQKELNQFEKEHALDLTQNKLDEMYELQKKELEDQTETIEKEFEDAKTKYESALSDIRAGSVTLYEEMIVWNQKYGDGIDDTIKTAWEEAYIALKNYHDLYGSFYEDIDLFNATGVPSKGKWESSPISGYASGTSNATAGLHKINEFGEEYIFKSATDGSTYKVFSGGEKVLNANATNFLYEFASSKGEILTNFISKLFDGSLLNKIIPSVSTNSIAMGDIIVQGNADMRTVSEIRRAQRENLADMLKSINKLNK